ncbi:YcnI family protein [Corallococcus macrosporus]|uniref:YcnI family protein n=1 Tax=Corallococcus macrosporus TaxID=35 RepID=A0ABS3D8R7_9BACT|nr:YcnI family protein [Corallococcus macrosporus]MBN8226735.1 YcnI family protein [Corallococcus macrosporus]
MKPFLGPLCVVAGSLLSSTAFAHATVAGATPPHAGATFEADFTVSHGCDGADTYRMRVQIPEGVTGVRPVDSVFGKAEVEKDANGNVTAVTWTRPTGEVKAADTHFFHLGLRMKLPAKPFTSVFFPTTQTCRTPAGVETVVEWSNTAGGEHSHDGDAGTAPAENPAPSLYLLPSRLPGWNQYTVQEHVHDLTVFKDALIVWSGSQAYSFNPVTQALIEKEQGVTALTQIHPGTVIWVKY